MELLKKFPHRQVYYWAMILMVIGLPLSMFLMSVAAITLASNWVLERNYAEKFKMFWANKGAVVLTSLFLLHVIGLLYTTDFDYAQRDLRIKLPLMFLPLVFTSIPKLTAKQFKRLLFIFIAANFLGTLHSYAVLLEWLEVDPPMRDARDMVRFVSHIRFSLFVGLSIFALGYYATQENWRFKLIYMALIAWFLVFLFVLGSPTGIIVLLGGFLVIMLYLGITRENWLVKLATVILLFGVPVSGYYYVRHCVNEYYTILDDESVLDTHTPGGEEYHHDLQNKQIESGHYVWRYIAYTELKNAWNQRSVFPYDSLDRAKQPISGTLIRYMSSKGLRKDSAGVMALNETDVANVEFGIANHKYVTRNGLRRRIDEIIFEFDVYLNGGNPSGNSLTQKFEFWRAANAIIRNNYWFGVGTGDVQMAFDKMYDEIGSPLREEYRLRAHNQYLTMLIAFGIVGFLWFLVTLFYPMIYSNKYFDYFYVMFFIVTILSFISEDTLETQAGITFFTFFNCLLLYGRKEELSPDASPESGS